VRSTAPAVGSRWRRGPELDLPCRSATTSPSRSLEAYAGSYCRSEHLSSMHFHIFCMLCLLAHTSVTVALSAEHVWGCLPGNVSHHMKFCNRSLPIGERVADLLANLTLKEKAGLLGAGTTTCAFMDAGVQRLGIPVYTWCVETNSGAGGICIAEGKCQSTFPAAAGLAASFNRTVWRTKGEIISTELRALNNIGGMRMGGPNDYIGLNGWGPNINVRVHHDYTMTIMPQHQQLDTWATRVLLTL
jgi:hypothetical protein